MTQDGHFEGSSVFVQEDSSGQDPEDHEARWGSQAGRYEHQVRHQQDGASPVVSIGKF